MSPEIIVAFITGVLGPVSVMLIKSFLDKNKKKDDLADFFLQWVYYLTLKKMITIHQGSEGGIEE